MADMCEECGVELDEMDIENDECSNCGHILSNEADSEDD